MEGGNGIAVVCPKEHSERSIMEQDVAVWESGIVQHFYTCSHRHGCHAWQREKRRGDACAGDEGTSEVGVGQTGFAHDASLGAALEEFVSVDGDWEWLPASTALLRTETMRREKHTEPAWD